MDHEITWPSSRVWESLGLISSAPSSRVWASLGLIASAPRDAVGHFTLMMATDTTEQMRVSELKKLVAGAGLEHHDCELLLTLQPLSGVY